MKTKKTLTKLYLLVLTVPIDKQHVIGDLLEKYDVTAFLSKPAKGSIDHVNDREMMFALIKENKIKDAFLEIEDKLERLKSKVSMVYAVPLDSMIGLSSYMGLTNGGK